MFAGLELCSMRCSVQYALLVVICIGFLTAQVISTVGTPLFASVSPLGGINTASGYSDGLGTDARFINPAGIFLSSGMLFVGDVATNSVRQIILTAGIFVLIMYCA
jgi:hypothetical protein